MRVRTLLIATGFVSAILGAVAAYLVLTVPNDLQAAALLRRARADEQGGHNDAARAELLRIVQQFPRTDAAAAATAALIELENGERLDLAHRMGALQHQSDRNVGLLSRLSQQVATIAATPAPQPVVVPPPAPRAAPRPAPAKHTRKRRRR